MAHIGKINCLRVVKKVDFGVYLDGDHLDNILLPKRYVPDDTDVGDYLDVFIYNDSDDLLIATTEIPDVTVGECAHLKVVDVNDMGAFLDWGLPKDLLVPYNEQHKPMEQDKSYVVNVFLDEHTDRLVASSKLNRHLEEQSFNEFNLLQEVDLLVCGRSDMGYKVVINHTHLGLIHNDDAFKPLRYGKQLKGYIKALRADGKINVSLQLPAAKGRDELSHKILEHLRMNNGVSTLTDKSAPDDIYHHFNVSKKNYKKALGALYKAKKITITPTEIKLV